MESDASVGGVPLGDMYSNGLVFWEPWKPREGSRVRVRYPGECKVDWGKVGDRLGENLGHPPEFDGATGVVFRIDDDYGAHRYAVAFDVVVAVARKNGAQARGAHFAAIELEPLDVSEVAELEALKRRFEHG